MPDEKSESSPQGVDSGRSSRAGGLPAVLEVELAAPHAWPADEAELRACVQRAVAAALMTAAQDGAQVERKGVPPLVEVVLADDDTVRALNAQWRGRDKPTNVLSFPADAAMPWVEDAPWPLGSVVLAGGVMRREAQARGVTLQDHLCWMVIHGILHLLGYDHQTEQEAARMEALERKALARLGLADPYATPHTLPA